MRVTVPASSANLGPGFDALGVALAMPFVLSDVPEEGLLAAEATHPAAVAHAAPGGRGALWWRSPIPPGRGLGFSGAARVAGALLGTGGDRDAALAVAVELEGHPDNAAASMLGGVVVAAGGRAVRVPLPVALDVVVWWPETATSTDRARAALPEVVPFADAVFNVGHSSLLVAALAVGDLDAVGAAVADRLHQDHRLAASPGSAAAIEALRGAGPVATWLSGSGPTVAAFARAGEGERLMAALPPDGTARVLTIDHDGAVLTDPSDI